jgi:O-antigen ligase
VSTVGTSRLIDRPNWTPVGLLLYGSFCLLMFSLPLEAPDRLPYEVTTLTGGLFIGCTLLSPRTCYGRMPWAITLFFLTYVVLALAVVTESARYPGGLHFDEVFKLLVLLLLSVLASWASSNLLRDERLFRATAWSLVLGCVIRAALPVFGIATSLHQEATGDVRVSALGQNPNQSAQVLAAGLLLLIGLLHLQVGRRPLYQRALGWCAAMLLAYGLLNTGSRGGLAMLVIGVVVILLTGPARMRLRSMALGLLMLAGLVTLALRTDVMRTRIEHAATTGKLAQREHIYPILLHMFAERPVTGWGPVSNKYELAARLGDPDYGSRDAHNIVLELLTSGGIAAAIPFFLGAWLCTRAAWQARSGLRGNLPLAVVVALLAGNMTQNRLTAFLLWIVLGCALASRSVVLSRASKRPSGANRRLPEELPVWAGPPRQAARTHP